MKEIGKKSFVSIERWENSKVQIDLLVNYENNLHTLIECKNYNKVFEVQNDVAENLLEKVENFCQNRPKKTKCDIVLVSMFGSKNRTSIRYVDFSLDEYINRKRVFFQPTLAN